jgi:glycosyltransferase involved in cell wall biosynthesis
LRRSVPAGLRELALMRLLYRRLEAAITETKPALIHAHSPVLVALPARLAARRQRLPFVYEVRDLWENASVDLGKFSSGSWRYRLARAADTRALQDADAVVVICDAMRREMEARLGSRAPIIVAGNGVQLEDLKCEESRTGRQRWQLGEGDVIGYVGTLHRFEGLDLLIDALPTLRRKRKGVRLLIAGDGPDEERLRSLVSERGLDGVVTFAGRISHAEVGQAYAACDLLVYPRAATETTRLTTPLKPLEAMALGRPVLVSRLAPLLELVQPGVTGAAFTAGNAADLASACLELLRHPDMRRQLGEAGRAWVVRERQWSATLRDYPRAYAAVMRSRAGEPAAALPATGAA